MSSDTGASICREHLVALSVQQSHAALPPHAIFFLSCYIRADSSRVLPAAVSQFSGFPIWSVLHCAICSCHLLCFYATTQRAGLARWGCVPAYALPGNLFLQNTYEIPQDMSLCFLFLIIYLKKIHILKNERIFILYSCALAFCWVSF